MSKNMKEYYEAFWGLIFPSNCSCIICKENTKTVQYGICVNCIEKNSFIKKGRWLQTAAFEEGYSCRIFSVVEYQGQIRKLIYRLKYKQETYLARELGKMMGDFIEREGLAADFIVPVPLHKSREKERGFNQATLLAKYVSESIGIPYKDRCLVRNKKTSVMHQLSKSQRRQNVLGAFSVERPAELIGQDIILLDDIFTTGATIEACIRTLLEAGVASIKVVAFARGKIEKSIGGEDWKDSDNDELSMYNEL
ncbi:ComF family protein [Alkaliphilus hydrothermalis]|uniref:ComF family protein n=2 Tax=Alkaliphilus hydrothermalis TaxID=1482730 RepID=A0ABS2NQZ1_9FIRM|nr:ComF family protein [Alkaliphilus hydrothermalis]